MRILVVAPGHAFSTIDVFDGLVAGLRSHGLDTKTYPLHDTLSVASALVDAAEAADALPAYPRAYDIATAGIPGICMAYGITHVIVVTGVNVPPSIPATLRRGGIVTALLCTESPYLTTEQERHIAQYYDVVFTNERAAVPLFDKNEPGTVHYLPHAYNPEKHTTDGEHGEPCDVFFCGTRFPERAALLDGVTWDGINLIDKTVWYAPGDDMAKAMSGTLPNTVVAARYRSARISLNHHRTTADWQTKAAITDPVYSLGPRAYEIPACGGFMICDNARAELTEVFGDSVPTYNPADPADLERVIRYYLANPEERDRLAAAQHAAVQAHSWAQRAIQVLEHLCRVSPGRVWPAVPIAA